MNGNVFVGSVSRLLRDGAWHSYPFYTHLFELTHGTDTRPRRDRSVGQLVNCIARFLRCNM